MMLGFCRMSPSAPDAEWYRSGTRKNRTPIERQVTLSTRTAAERVMVNLLIKIAVRLVSMSGSALPN